MEAFSCFVWLTLGLVSITFAVHSLESTSEYRKFNKRSKPSVIRESCVNNSATPVNRVDTGDRLRRLRLSMKAITPKYDAYIIPSSDEHQSEFVADHDQRRKFISGFSGSAGTAVVLQEVAALWTDGRYFLQAESELDCNWLLMKSQEPGVPSIDDWIVKTLNAGSRVGADSKLITYHKWMNLKEKFQKSNITLIADDSNLIDGIWTIPQGRPLKSVSHIFIHDEKYAGKTWQDKVQEVLNIVNKTGASGLIVTNLDEICWLFNLRGSDVPFIPIFKAYALISDSVLKIYVGSLKVTAEVKKYLCPKNETTLECVQTVNYEEAFEDMKSIVKISEKFLVSSLSSFSVVNIVPEERRLLQEGAAPIAKLKVIKNPVEVAGMKNAALKDAVAIVDFIAMLEEEVKFGKHWDEMKAVRTLTKYRREQELNQGESFATISAFGANAAVIHYKPQLSTNRNINAKHMYLLDSGGQYLDGTTDITRTFHFGEPTEYEVESYTRVLMGVIDLITVTFPDGIQDKFLDIFARRSLYSAGLNYHHGTGHGIGHFLNVHEGTIAISDSAANKGGYVLKPGMFLSNEPGYYADNKFGIRLETMMVVVKAFPKYYSDVKAYYTFEPVSFVPFEPKLIDLHLLSKKQKEWLNNYNIKTRNTVGLELRKQNRKRGFHWLLSKTEHIPVESCDSDVSSASQLYVKSNFVIVVTVFIFICL